MPDPTHRRDPERARRTPVSTMPRLAPPAAGVLILALAALGSLFPAGLTAQGAVDGAVARPTPPRGTTVTAGVGTSMGWYGAQVERYALGGRASLFAGLGYAFARADEEPDGAAFAAGVRGYTEGRNHRGSLTLAFAQVATTFTEGSGEMGDRYFGPAVLAGYQYTADGGFTLMAGLGLGYGVGVESDDDLLWGSFMPALDLGFGYTWR